MWHIWALHHHGYRMSILIHLLCQMYFDWLKLKSRIIILQNKSDVLQIWRLHIIYNVYLLWLCMSVIPCATSFNLVNYDKSGAKHQYTRFVSIIYPFPNFHNANVEVWEWINNFVSYFIMDVITYSCLDLSKSMQVNGVNGHFAPGGGWLQKQYLKH